MAKKTTLMKVPDTLTRVWEQAYGLIVPEHPFITWQSEKKTHVASWKETNAMAHCMAGFLLSKDVKKGEAFGVFSSNNPAVIYLELGAHLIGAIPVMIPGEVNSSQLSEIAQETGLKVLVVSDADRYHKAIAGLGSNFSVQHIITLFDDDQVLVPGRTAIFDWVVDPGKVYWREHLVEINTLKASVQPDDVCCITYTFINDHLNSKIDTHEIFIQELQQCLNSFQEIQQNGSFLICQPYANRLNRLLGLYLPLILVKQILIPHSRATIEQAIRYLEPKWALLSSTQLNGLAERLMGKVTLKNWYKRYVYQRAIKVGEKYFKALDNQMKPNLWLKYRYSKSKQRLRKGFLKMLHPEIQGVILNDKGLSEMTITLFLHMEMPIYDALGNRITRENRFQLIGKNPASDSFVG